MRTGVISTREVRSPGVLGVFIGAIGGGGGAGGAPNVVRSVKSDA